MAEHNDTGEKTEQPTPRKLEEALKHGQIARSAEVQTAFVLLGALAALTFAGPEIWRQLVARQRHDLQPSARHDASPPRRCRATRSPARWFFSNAPGRSSSPPCWPGCWRAPSKTGSTPRPRRSRPIGSGSIRSSRFPARLFVPQRGADADCHPEICRHRGADLFAGARDFERSHFHHGGGRRAAGGISGADLSAYFPAGEPGAARHCRRRLRLPMVAHAAGLDDDQGGVEGGNEKHGRQPDDEGRAPPPPHS